MGLLPPDFDSRISASHSGASRERKTERSLKSQSALFVDVPPRRNLVSIGWLVDSALPIDTVFEFCLYQVSVNTGNAVHIPSSSSSGQRNRRRRWRSSSTSSTSADASASMSEPGGAMTRRTKNLNTSYATYDIPASATIAESWLT